MKTGCAEAPLSSPTEERENLDIDPLLTLPEIAGELRCSKGHVSHLINGKVPGIPLLPAIALGRRRLIRRSTFEEWKKAAEAACQTATLLPLNNAVNA